MRWRVFFLMVFALIGSAPVVSAQQSSMNCTPRGAQKVAFTRTLVGRNFGKARGSLDDAGHLHVADSDLPRS